MCAGLFPLLCITAASFSVFDAPMTTAVWRKGKVVRRWVRTDGGGVGETW